jgi:hypothetical protein
LLADSCAAADHAIQFGANQDEEEAQTPGRYTGPLNGLSQRVAWQLTAAAQSARQHLVTPGEHSLIEVERAIAGRHRGIHARSGQPEHPTDVSRRDEVPRGAHDVGPQQAALGKCLLDRPVGSDAHALGDGPFRPSVVLSLDGTHPPHDILRSGEIRGREVVGCGQLHTSMNRSLYSAAGIRQRSYRPKSR